MTPDRLAEIKARLKQGKPAMTVTGVLALLTAVGMWGCPHYNVWERGMAGKSQLAEADWNRQIAIREAEAKLESAKALAQAEVERAKGLAEAQHIIASTLSESYLRYLFIQSLEQGECQYVYVPTEATLPILEAGRLGAP